MNKPLNFLITLCMLACGIGFLYLGGSPFLQLLSGPEALESGEALEEAEGKYLAYEAAYPIASCVEEYYSGDPDRARTMGYAVYDEERDTFLYVIVPEHKQQEIRKLMENLQLSEEYLAGKDMSPVTVKGSLEPMDKEAVGRAADALLEAGVFPEKIPEDGWYYIEAGTIHGMAASAVWITILAAAVSLLIFLVRLISMFTGGGKKAAGAASASKMTGFLEAQRGWVASWCDFSLKRARKISYLLVIGGAVILFGIGLFAGGPIKGILTFHLPLGVLLGEGAAILLWESQKGQAKPSKILKRLEKSIIKELPNQADQEAFAEELLAAEPEWTFQELTKEGMIHGQVGSRFWCVFSGIGTAVIIDSQLLGKIETATVSGQVRSGKVRINYVSYVARFFYRSAEQKKKCDKEVSFLVQDTLGHFMVLVRKRGGDTIEIVAE